MNDSAKARLEAYKRRIGKAKEDRTKFASRINAIYEFGLPDRLRIDAGSTAANPDEQNDIYDEILQDNIEDFASDMMDLFTPKYRDWTTFNAAETLNLPKAQHAQLNKDLQTYGSAVFQSIRNSNFYSVAQDCWMDVACAVGAGLIPYPGLGPVVCHYIPPAELLIEEGPQGIDGRWWEQKTKVRYLEALWPSVDWTAIKKKYPTEHDLDRDITVTQGAVRDWSYTADEKWLWHIIAENEIVHEEEFVGEGSCPLIPFRWKRSHPSAWGLGPASKALAPTRTLNVLARDILTMVGKMADTPHSYEEDGVFNPEQGIGPGDYVPRLMGSKKPEPLFYAENPQVVYFEQEDLRQRVRRALYQDKPVQRGDTPPTLGQWFDEKTTNNRRMENPRDRIVTEWVLPVIKRFAWIEKTAGRLPEVKIGDRSINVEIQSPLSKASDMEDVSTATSVLQIAQGFMPQMLPLIINGKATIENIKSKLSDDIVTLNTDEEIAQLLAAQAAQASLGGPSGG